MISNIPEAFESGITGAAPWEWQDTVDPDGDRGPWANAPVGSIYYKKSATIQKTFTRVKTGGRDDDWVQGLHCLSVTVTRSQFTDGGSTSGTYAVTETIPQGAWVQQSVLVNVTGFTGDTSAVINVGDGSDVDRYNTGNPSVFTTANAIDLGVPSGTKIHTAAATITITVTSGADFTNVAAGQLTLRIYYLN